MYPTIWWPRLWAFSLSRGLKIVVFNGTTSSSTSRDILFLVLRIIQGPGFLNYEGLWSLVHLLPNLSSSMIGFQGTEGPLWTALVRQGGTKYIRIWKAT